MVYLLVSCCQQKLLLRLLLATVMEGYLNTPTSQFKWETSSSSGCCLTHRLNNQFVFAMSSSSITIRLSGHSVTLTLTLTLLILVYIPQQSECSTTGHTYICINIHFINMQTKHNTGNQSSTLLPVFYVTQHYFFDLCTLTAVHFSRPEMLVLYFWQCSWQHCLVVKVPHQLYDTLTTQRWCALTKLLNL